MSSLTLPDQNVLVEAIGSALPGYEMSADDWLSVCITLRLVSRNGNTSMAAVFLEDVARAADAMHCRLNGDSVYAGKEALDKALGEA